MEQCQSLYICKFNVHLLLTFQLIMVKIFCILNCLRLLVSGKQNFKVNGVFQYASKSTNGFCFLNKVPVTSTLESG